MPKHYLKRLSDIIISFTAIIVCLPIFFMIALAIKIEGLLDSSSCGPIIHKELRVSQGEIFKTLKFRTVKQSFLEVVKKDPDKQSISGIMYDKPEAVTKVGRFLMKYYFDEFPQLFNVLKGEMSIVGPRPQLPFIYQNRLNKGDYSLKHLKTAICGLNQSCKKSPHLKKRLINFYRKKIPNFDFQNLDQVYLYKYKNYSSLKLLVFDLKLIWMTFQESLRGKGLKKHINLYS